MKRESEVRSQESEGRDAQVSGAAGGRDRAPLAVSPQPPAVHTPEGSVARPPAKSGGAGQLPLIPDEWRSLVEELLTTGSTAEDVVEAVIGQGGPEISV